MNEALGAVAWAGNGRVAVSVPAGDAEEALAVWEAGEGLVVPSLRAATFPNPEAIREETARCLSRVPVFSIALGGGADVSQWRMVLVAAEAGAPHLNQPFTTAAFAKGRFPGAWVNGVVEPTNDSGRVRLTGIRNPLPVVHPEEAARMLLDGQVNALKLHPTDPEYRFQTTVAIATAAAQAGVTAFEPAGRIDLTGLPRLVDQLMAVPGLRILPHVFGAVLDRATQRVDLGRVRSLVGDLKAAVGD